MSVIWQQRTHGVLRRKQQSGRMFTHVFIIAAVILTVLAAAYLALVASNVHTSRQVWALEKELLETQRQNHALRIEITRFSSIPMLQERSVKLGYQPATSVDYIHIVDIGEP